MALSRVFRGAANRTRVKGSRVSFQEQACGTLTSTGTSLLRNLLEVYVVMLAALSGCSNKHAAALTYMLMLAG